MSLEDQPTEQIRRVQPAAPMPEPMNPAGPPPATSPPGENPNDGTTGVLSIDDLFEAPSTTASPAATTTPPAPQVTTTAPPSAGPPPAGSTPVGPAPATPAAPVDGRPRIGAVPAAPTGRGRGVTDRLRGCGVAGWPGLTRSRDWLTTGDNAVIVSTACVVLLLLLAVALF
jgi:hypothetical protein